MLYSDRQGKEPITLKCGEHFDGEFPMEFLAINGKECVKQARNMGWKFCRDGRNLCPRCNNGGIQLKKE